MRTSAPTPVPTLPVAPRPPAAPREGGADAAAGLRPRVPRDGAAGGVAADDRRRAVGRVRRLRVALAVRPFPGRPSAHRGSDLRAVRRAGGACDGHVEGAAGAPCACRGIPQRGVDGEDDLDARRRERRARGARGRGRLGAGRGGRPPPRPSPPPPGAGGPPPPPPGPSTRAPPRA